MTYPSLEEITDRYNAVLQQLAASFDALQDSFDELETVCDALEEDKFEGWFGLNNKYSKASYSSLSTRQEDEFLPVVHNQVGLLAGQMAAYQSKI
jgi:hypothetical protein